MEINSRGRCRTLLLLCAIVGLIGGCAMDEERLESADFGESVRYTIALQTEYPDSAGTGMDAQKAANVMQPRPVNPTTSSTAVFSGLSVHMRGLWYPSQSAARGKSCSHGSGDRGGLKDLRVPPYTRLPPCPITLPSRNFWLRRFCKS